MNNVIYIEFDERKPGMAMCALAVALAWAPMVVVWLILGGWG